MENNPMQKVAEKSVVADVVGDAFGFIVSSCVTKMTEGVIENMLPEPNDLKTKVMYGIGSYAIGGMAGLFAAEQAKNTMLVFSGSVLTIKTAIGEMVKSINHQQTEKN